MPVSTFLKSHVKNYEWILSFQPKPDSIGLENILEKAIQHAPMDILQSLFTEGFLYDPEDMLFENFLYVFKLRRWKLDELRDFMEFCAQKFSRHRTSFQLVQWIFFERRDDQSLNSRRELL